MTKLQFFRILDREKVPISDHQRDILAKRYSDKLDTDEDMT